MKTIVLVALLAAACSKQPTDLCGASIGKGMETFTAAIKDRASNPGMQQMMLGVVDKLKVTLVKRCTDDRWPAKVATCFEKVTSQREIKACLDQLPADLRGKTSAEIREVMMGGARMPTGLPGHPETRAGSAEYFANQGSGSSAGSAAPAGSATPATESAPAGSAAPADSAGSAR